MKFENTTVYLNTTCLPAITATLNESIGITRIDDLGRHSVGCWSNSRPEGSFSASLVLHEGIISFINDCTGIKLISGCIGTNSFSKGFLNEFKISIDPDSNVESDISIDFYSKIGQTTALPFTGNAFELPHGGASYAETGLFTPKLSSLEYSITQKVAPSWGFGGYDLLTAKRTDGQIKISLNGTGLQHVVHENCDDLINFSLNLNSLCNIDIGTINVSGMKVESSNLTLNLNDDLVGSIELIKYF